MLDTLLPLAYGPIGGIDPKVAVFFVVLWTVILGGALYASVLIFPQWVPLEDEGGPQTHH